MREGLLWAARPEPVGAEAPATAERFRSARLPVRSPDTGRVARRLAREVSRDWGVERLADDVELCVSELVGNAVHHAGPQGRGTEPGSRQVALAFRAHPRWLSVEVADGDSALPGVPRGDLSASGLFDLPHHDLLQDGGRGLFLVCALADAVWWVPREGGGKSVFCRFGLHGDR
ncbi:ATP-binding protein [Streptomyces sp. GSL17-111]|uniref:ATP-binding protein n=1 Tax=Streptomyces sp. GSL17-111 TaxID=3121596 RepID=UPI0030F49AB6